MYEIAKTFSFSAAHQLPYLGPDHKCSRLHGHNYTVEIALRSTSLNSDSFVMDYALLGFAKTWIDEVLDHRNLNDVMGTDHTTAEMLCQFIYYELKQRVILLYKVTVTETPNTMASYWEESS